MTKSSAEIIDFSGKRLLALKAFLKRNGSAHLLFASHAALPIGLTPELLYSIWSNFQVDSYDKSIITPWTATADLLLSGLCEEVGAGLYEMDRQIRFTLLEYLEKNERFGLKRIRELALFLGDYVQPQLKSEDLDIRSLAQVQNWVSMAYLNPRRVVKELAFTLANAFRHKPGDLLRIASIVGSLERPLAAYPDFLTYAQGMAKYALEDIDAAQKEFDKIRQSQSLYELSSEGLPLPKSSRERVNIVRNKKSPYLPLGLQLIRGCLKSRS